MNTLTQLLTAMSFGVIGGVVTGMLLLCVLTGLERFQDWLEKRRRERIARVEAELDRKQEQLRRTILTLAAHLAADRNETSRQLTRTAFLASERTPPSS